MKKVFWNIVLPLTFISYAGISQWWEYSVVEGQNQILWGFPFPMAKPNDALGLDVFLLGGMANFLIYLCFWFLVCSLIIRWKGQFKVSPLFNYGLKIIAGIHLGSLVIFSLNPGNKMEWQRSFEIKVIDKGIIAYGYPLPFTKEKERVYLFGNANSHNSSPDLIRTPNNEVIKHTEKTAENLHSMVKSK